MTVTNNIYSPQRASKLSSQEVQDLQGTPSGLLTGIQDFDELLYPLRSNLCIVHGITNHGKSTLADIIAENNMPAPDGNEIIVKVLLEDTIEEQVIREASTHTQPFLSVSDITSGKMNTDQLKTFNRALVTLATQPVWRIGNSRADYANQRRATVDMIFDAIAWIKSNQDKKIRLIVLDYFQRIAAHKGGDPRHIYIDQVEKLDAMAQGFGSPMLLLSQSSREANKAKRVPMEYDLKETGSLEEAARTIIVVYRPHIHVGAGKLWDFAGMSIKLDADNYVLLGIQKQKYKESPVYRIFKTNEQRKMTRVILKGLND